MTAVLTPTYTAGTGTSSQQNDTPKDTAIKDESAHEGETAQERAAAGQWSRTIARGVASVERSPWVEERCADGVRPPATWRKTLGLRRGTVVGGLCSGRVGVCSR
eukprot:GHVU01043768.1.p1 GENE.GHVU01043768.1~~GHVU01043768.1.p1  ORF type:complete len:105 (-),score=3.32 GHVU01043768.1:18-332(-)